MNAYKYIYGDCHGARVHLPIWTAQRIYISGRTGQGYKNSPCSSSTSREA